jgi:hypothetical protein
VPRIHSPCKDHSQRRSRWSRLRRRTNRAAPDSDLPRQTHWHLSGWTGKSDRPQRCRVSCKNSRMNADSKPLRWSGAGRVPAVFMSWQATTPLVVLELIGSRLTLRFRPALLAKFLGIETLTAIPDDKLRIFLIQNDRTWKGIEFRLPERSSFLFYTPHREQVLETLTRAGFVVSTDAGRKR